MKLNRKVFDSLVPLASQSVIIMAPMSPQFIFGFQTEKHFQEKYQGASVEFGWTGIQVVCTNETAIEIFQKNNNGCYAVEGIGYFALVEDLFEGFSQTGLESLPESDNNYITEFISGLVGSKIQGEIEQGKIIVVQLVPEDMGFPNGTVGFRVHVMLPVSEEYWLGLYQIHKLELQSATKFYEELKGITGAEEDIAANFNPARTLN